MSLYLVSTQGSAASDLLRHRLGQAIRTERITQGKSLQDLATDANLSPSHLSDIERGTKEGSSEVIRGIHQALGLELDDLLQRMTTNDSPQLTIAA